MEREYVGGVKQPISCRRNNVEKTNFEVIDSPLYVIGLHTNSGTKSASETFIFY